MQNFTGYLKLGLNVLYCIARHATEHKKEDNIIWVYSTCSYSLELGMLMAVIHYVLPHFYIFS